MRLFGILSLTVLLLYCGLSYACGRAEYEINSQNCQMCPAGKHVNKHCTENEKTECVPCAPETYIDDLNCLPECLPCQVCDKERGLKTYSNCTATSNTVCEPLDHHYCTERDKWGCRQAQKHTICLPGQFIQRNGTTSNDTECADCPDKSFSNTSSATGCEPHKDCQSVGHVEIKAGTNTSDTQCRSWSCSDSPACIFGAVVAAAVGVLVVVGVGYLANMCHHSGCPCAQTSGALPSTVAQQTSGALPTDIALQNMSSVQMKTETEQADEETTEMVGLLQNGGCASVHTNGAMPTTEAS
ncbi:hypothetical protein GJAV_G00105910 [Gymnothorax javanicus]|nr:hypothetical protein GJAV_G00105910 [Gymnothorax javanicus]